MSQSRMPADHLSGDGLDHVAEAPDGSAPNNGCCARSKKKFGAKNLGNLPGYCASPVQKY
jgi:hypothetical protein